MSVLIVPGFLLLLLLIVWVLLTIWSSLASALAAWVTQQDVKSSDDEIIDQRLAFLTEPLDVIYYDRYVQERLNKLLNGDDIDTIDDNGVPTDQMSLIHKSNYWDKKEQERSRKKLML